MEQEKQTDELALCGSVDEVDSRNVENMMKVLVREIRLIGVQIIRPRPQFPSKL